MEARSVSTVIPMDPVTGVAVEPMVVADARPTSRKKPISRPIPLTRGQEYAYIRSDLRRLLITAGSLLVLMLVILFIVEG